MSKPRRRWKGERVNERVSVCLTASVRDQLNEIAVRRGLGEGETVRLAIAAWLAQQPQEAGEE